MDSNSQLLALKTNCFQLWAKQHNSKMYELERSHIRPNSVLHHLSHFIITHLRSTSHSRRTYMYILQDTQVLCICRVLQIGCIKRGLNSQPHELHSLCRFLSKHHEIVYPSNYIYFSDDKTTTDEA